MQLKKIQGRLCAEGKGGGNGGEIKKKKNASRSKSQKKNGLNFQF